MTETTKPPRRRKPASKTAAVHASGSPPAPAAESPVTANRVDAHATAARTLMQVPVELRWRDLDAFNHVNNSSYLTFLEEARLRWLSTIDGPWFFEDSMPVLASVNLNYRRPLGWPAKIVVELDCLRVGATSLTIAHRIVDADDGNVLYCDGHVVMVWMNPAAGRSAPLPDAIRAACEG